MMRITQTREMTKVRRNAMKASRARCRTGRGGALCFRVSFVLSSFQFMMTENSTADYADYTDGNKAKNVSGSRFLIRAHPRNPRLKFLPSESQMSFKGF